MSQLRSVPETAETAQRAPAGSPAESTVADAGFRTAWPAVASYAGLRLVSILFLWYFAAEQHRGLRSLLGKYDAAHYTSIVTHGYDRFIPLKPNGDLATTNLAFFPLYPKLTALLDPILPGGAAAAGILVSWLAGLAAAWGLYAVGAHLRDRRTGVVLAALWAVLPHALVQSMGYTETLFTALAAWSLFALLRRRWLTAGLLCLLAGLTRPTGAAQVAVVGLAALIAICRRQDGWRPWLAGALAPLGFLGYVVWVGHRLGRADGYFYVQRDAWKMSYDTGAYTLRTMHDMLVKAEPVAYVVTTIVVLIAIALLALLVTGRVPWPLAVYSAVVVAMAFFGDSYYHAKARLLMPAFPLLLPIAYALARSRRPTLVVALTTLTVISAGYGTYLALAWPYSP
jgi:hypothetical protein